MSTPAMAPVAPPYVPSHVKMYEWGSLYRFQGWMRIPMTPVMSPPVRNEIRFGQAFEKSYDGLTVFAATFTESVATASVKSARTMTMGLLNLPVRATGSQIAVP